MFLVQVIATLLTGNSEAIVADAIGSVIDWVDALLLIDTGVTDGTLERARDAAGSKLVRRVFAWTGDFSAARNFALETATALGADWAVTIDSDERLVLGGLDVRAELARAQESVLHVFDAHRTYVKERFFKLPAAARWRGPTHETFPTAPHHSRTLEGMRFDELPKSPEALQRKLERDALLLAAYAQQHPDEPRWPFYLGESLSQLGRPELAIQAYERCAALRGWDEESAWACYQAADCLCKLGRFEAALDRCVQGLARHAGIAELAWLAGYACYQLGRYVQARYWAELATVHGAFRGDAAAIGRLGFRDPPALWEGPYDLLRWSAKKLGNTEAAQAAEQLWLAAKAARERSH